MIGLEKPKCENCRCNTCENDSCKWVQCKKKEPTNKCFSKECPYFHSEDDDIEEGFYDGYGD